MMASSAVSSKQSSASSGGENLELQIDELSQGKRQNDWRDNYSKEGANDSQEYQQREDEEDGASENVAVAVRCRPLPQEAEQQQQQRKQQVVVEVDEEEAQVVVSGNEHAERRFQFDQAFGALSTSEQVYMRSARHLVQWAFNGYNCTLFLYGQTGTGKTHTHSGLTQAAFEHLFSLISSSNTRARFLIRASYYELYNEEIRDLLSNSNKPLELRESKARGVYVRDLSCFLVNNLMELAKLKRLGDKKRATAATKMNLHSSRSHSIFSITIETIMEAATGGGDDGQRRDSIKPAGVRPAAGAGKQATGGGGESVRLGRLNLVDLAGSERQCKSGSTGARLKEASRINLSLTCLSLVIRALTDKSARHVPYRNSKLTRLLSSSLGGNSKTLLIACISSAKLHLDETLDTLRFATRTKLIKNRARVNEDAKDALLRKYRRQISELRKKLQEQQREQEQQEQQQPPVCLSEEDTIESTILRQKEQQQKQQQQQQILDAAADGEQRNEQQQQQQLAGGDANLALQLKMLRAKIMSGGENLLDKVAMHEKLLEASKQELEAKRRREAKLKRHLERKRAIIEQVEQSKDNLEGQRLDLDDKLGRVLDLYAASKEELADGASEHEQLKEQLLQTIRATSKEIKYADCIIEDFIPRDHLDLINTNAHYDEESDEWQIKYIAMSGNNIAQTRLLTRNTPAPSTPMVVANEILVRSDTANNNHNAADGSDLSEEDDNLDEQRSAQRGLRPAYLGGENNRPDPFIRLSSAKLPS